MLKRMGEMQSCCRNIRRDGNDHIKKIGLSEDDEKGYLEDVQDLTINLLKK
jgi:ribosome recycling factor